MVEKKVKGRKRHSVTDTQGHLLHIKVHAANIHDTVGGCSVFQEALQKYPNLKGVCADAGIAKPWKNWWKKFSIKPLKSLLALVKAGPF